MENKILKNNIHTVKDDMYIQKIKRGDVFYASLKKGKHVQGGIRPVIIIQNDIGNKFAPIVNVIPLSSKIGKKLPIHIEINADFLNMKSIALCEQNMPISKDQLLEKIGHLSATDMLKVQKGIMMQFGFMPLTPKNIFIN